jgi:chlorite dismutase
LELNLTKIARGEHFMSDQTAKQLHHFAFFSFTDEYYSLPGPERSRVNREWLDCLRQASGQVEIFQVYPAGENSDLLVWSALEASSSEDAARFFSSFAAGTNQHRQYVQPSTILWGFTKPSQYTKTRSTQEMDAFSGDRKPYLVVYPFAKTASWYMMSREARQGMMNEHIRIGKQYPEINQLLLYSFGLQDQEFIVVYETDDLGMFSDLVYELRSSEARRYTERDTPLFTAVYHPAEETLALWA